MQEKNFRDEVTGEEVIVTSYKMRIVDGLVCFVDLNGNTLTNPSTGNKLVHLENPKRKGFPMVAKFNPHSTDGMRKIKDHFGTRAHRDNTRGAGKDTRDSKLKSFKDELKDGIQSGRVKI